ncbi:hypothetical protein BC829DRAFT_384198 [Chytridium lagenaria]|nr:hypothetical protein BC829DRAFT_384198 [Chytridium lagenaria]
MSHEVEVDISYEGSNDVSLLLPVEWNGLEVVSINWDQLRGNSKLPAELEALIKQAGHCAVDKAMTVANELASSQQIQSSDNQRLVEEWKSLFRTQCQAYTNRTEPIFPKAYNALINSSTPSRRSYAEAVEDAHRTKEQTLADMESQHVMAMEMAVQQSPNSTPNLSYLVERHVEATTESQLQELYSTQRSEYRDFVVKVYDEMMSREAKDYNDSRKNSPIDEDTQAGQFLKVNSVDPPPPVETLAKGNDESGRQVVSAAIRKLERMPSNEMLITGGIRNRNDDQKRVFSDPADPDLLRKIKEIEEMGFTTVQARASLSLSNRNTESAVSLLLEDPDRISQFIATSAQAAKKERTLKSSLSNGSLSKTNQVAAWPRFPSPLNNSPGGSRGSVSGSQSGTPQDSPSLIRRNFSPLAFIQQQQARLTAQGAAPLKKMSSMLGKAIGAFVTDDDEATPNPDISDLSESFTIFFGTQVKTMYNLRLSVLNVSDLLFQLQPDPSQELAYRAQTAASLYSHDLSAAILLIEAKDFKKYSSGKSANKAFIQKCKRSTEFHFDDVETQLSRIEDLISTDEAGEPILQEGDFFVTKHSNIPQIHLIFHLVTTEESLKTDLTSRSALIHGYRSILRVASKCDVNHITVPLLLLPEPAIEGNGKNAVSNAFILSEIAIQKRAELVLKSTKGLIMENSRSSKHAGDSSGMEKHGRSFQFLLPTYMPKYVECFSVVREKLAEVFTTS